MNLRGVLFDLDGTLVDTAPDLVAALHAVWVWRQREGPLPNLPWSSLVSQGAMALIEAAMGPTTAKARDEELLYFLEHYKNNIFTHSIIFSGVIDALDKLAKRGVSLGVVTNKSESLAHRLLDQSGLSHRFSVVIGGDSLPHKKPAPEPLLAACDALHVLPEQTVMVGDDQRDMVAAIRANMACVVAMWGYGVDQIEMDAHESMMVCAAPIDLPTVLGVDD